MNSTPAPGERPRRPATPEEATALASALRLRILRLTYQNPMTNKQLAEQLGRDPATTLHHVRKLVAAGFLDPLPTRRGTRGAREIPYLATGVSWSLEPAPGEDEAAVSQAMLEAFLGEVADVGTQQLSQTRLALRLDTAELTEFRERLAELLQEFAARPPRPNAPLLAVYVALHGGSPRQ